jgi:hypothetical protein
LRRIFARFQCERGKNSPFNSGDDDIKEAGVIHTYLVAFPVILNISGTISLANKRQTNNNIQLDGSDNTSLA